MRILNVDVPKDLSTRWRGLVAPEWQPFFVEPEDGFTTSTTAPDISSRAQTWWTVRGVHRVRDLIRANRSRGQRLARHRIVAGG